MTQPLATVVIPTRNRGAVISATLDALARQDCAAGSFEVVVAVNASQDDTVDTLAGRRWPFAMRLLDVPMAGASHARNQGANAGRGALVIFLDDDIEVEPQFVRAHLEAHLAGSNPNLLSDSQRVVIGYLPARLQPVRDRFAIVLREWWEAMFDRMREPGHRWAWTDLLSGNCSLSRRWFLEVGGFNESLRCHEDWELGYRLIAAEAEFGFAESAVGRHADETRLTRACWRKREEGVADALLGAMHPELRTALPMARVATIKQRMLRWLAFQWPAAGDAVTSLLARLLPVLERGGATMAWVRVVYAVFGYWYARGLADVLQTRTNLRQLLANAWDEPRVQDVGPIVDLLAGVDAASAQVDRTRPDAARLHVGSTFIAQIPWIPGAEPLASHHVRALLMRFYHRPLVEALLAQEVLTFEELVGVSRRADRSGAPAAGDNPIALVPEHT
jgi:GT2 family glycosyltransferase